MQINSQVRRCLKDGALIERYDSPAAIGHPWPWLEVSVFVET